MVLHRAVLRRPAAGVVALVFVVAAAGTIGCRRAYGTWWQTPQCVSTTARAPTWAVGNHLTGPKSAESGAQRVRLVMSVYVTTGPDTYTAYA